jgi:DNA-binding MarR family transcriptional regulator
MPEYPTLNAQVIGQAESALGAILNPVLAPTGTTPLQWFVLAVAAGSNGTASRDQIAGRVAGARKADPAQVQAAIAELAGAGLLELPGEGAALQLTAEGQARVQGIRSTVGEITARIFGGIPAGDLALAGRVLAAVTERANAELSSLGW